MFTKTKKNNEVICVNFAKRNKIGYDFSQLVRLEKLSIMCTH